MNRLGSLKRLSSTSSIGLLKCFAPPSFDNLLNALSNFTQLLKHVVQGSPYSIHTDRDQSGRELFVQGIGTEFYQKLLSGSLV
jgi:hypothetical protein